MLHAGRTRVVSECRILSVDAKLLTTARGSFVPNARFVEMVQAG